MSYPILHILGRPSEVLDEGPDKDSPSRQRNHDADKCLEQRDWFLAQEYAEQASQLAECGGDHVQKACAMIRQAEIYRAQRHFQDALHYYGMAEQSFSRAGKSHNLAATWTFMAELYGENRDWPQVFVHFRNASQVLAQLEAESVGAGKPSDAAIYRDWQNRIKQAEKEARTRAATRVPIGQIALPPPRALPHGWLELAQLPVLDGPIPAGAPRDLTRLPHQSNIRVNQLVINNQSYSIKSLDACPDVFLAPEQSYVIAPVIDNSLELLGIIKDDLVILQSMTSPDMAVDGDIVVAEISQNREVTLKQYLVADGKQYLVASSPSPAWQNQVAVNHTVRILGIVIAILKQTGQVPPSHDWIEFTQLSVLDAPIPAGAPRDLSRLLHRNAAADQVTVNNLAYEIKTPDKYPRVLIMPQCLYAVVPVLGDSMNLMGITNRDLVVLQHVNSLEMVGHGDIVVAEAVQDPQATLKQYLILNGKRYIRASSSNPQWQNYQAEVDNVNVWIRGVVVAVLKPLP